VASLGGELVSIVEGRSNLAPAKGDKRFADPAWKDNPLLKRTMQGYLATSDTAAQLFSDAHLDWRDAERIRFCMDVIAEGLSPTASAEQGSGSWWPDYAAWLAERSGEKKDAPGSIGGAGMEPLEPAPGSYVHDK
jgi:hypothetical protein